MPQQVDRVIDDPTKIPDYERKLEFLESMNIDKPYDCFQCTLFDMEFDGCYTPYIELYCSNIRGDRMCPGFEPPKEGRFEFVLRSA